MSAKPPKQAEEMTRAELAAVPHRHWNEEIRCGSLIIMPSRRRHDSGFLCMDFVAVGHGGLAICALAGGTDVLTIEGFGGRGRWKPGGDGYIPPAGAGWSIDCLPRSGLLQMWPEGDGIEILVDHALSSMCIYQVRMGGKE